MFPFHGEIHCSSVGSRWVLFICSKVSFQSCSKQTQKQFKSKLLNSRISAQKVQACNKNLRNICKIWRNDFSSSHIWTHDIYIAHPTLTTPFPWESSSGLTAWIGVWFSEIVKPQLPELKTKKSQSIIGHVLLETYWYLLKTNIYSIYIYYIYNMHIGLYMRLWHVLIIQSFQH